MLYTARTTTVIISTTTTTIIINGIITFTEKNMRTAQVLFLTLIEGKGSHHSNTTVFNSIHTKL